MFVLQRAAGNWASKIDASKMLHLDKENVGPVNRVFVQYEYQARELKALDLSTEELLAWSVYQDKVQAWGWELVSSLSGKSGTAMCLPPGADLVLGSAPVIYGVLLGPEDLKVRNATACSCSVHAHMFEPRQ